MNIVLVNLPWKRGNRWGVRAGSRWPHIKDQTEENYLPFPFYLAYAAALLKKNGFNVSIVDAIAGQISYPDFYARVLALKPDLLVAETSTVSLRHDVAFLSRFQGKSAIVLCGPDVHIADAGFLQRTPHIDYVLYGEYEATLLELAQKLGGNAPLAGVAGLVYRSGGAAFKNAPRALITDLDGLPWPERTSLPLKRYNDAPGDIPLPCASMWASRGCPFRCSFCLWPQVMYGGNSYRVRGVKDVVDEMEYLVKKLGFKSIYFDDDTWNVGRQRMLSFCAELKARDLRIPWAIMARAELMDEELLETMRDAGLFAVKYGIESSSQQILDRIGKGLDLKKAEEIVKYTKYLGIRTHLTFTFGLPGENSRTIRETIDYATVLNPTSVQFSLATPFPGTKFYQEMDAKGYLLTKDLEKLDGNHHSVIKTAELTAADLERAKKQAYDRWNKHYLIKRKKLIFRQKSLKEKFSESLQTLGRMGTLLKTVRFVLRKIIFLPLRIRQYFNKNLWIIEETIAAGNVNIKFGEGQVRVYWKDREISKGVGMTTSFYYGERWFDSSQAHWKLEKTADNRIDIKLNWDEAPIRQEWQIVLHEEGAVTWHSSMRVERPVQLLECKAGIMLQDDYPLWKDDLGVGKFPPVLRWEEIELYNATSKMIGVMPEESREKNALPEVVLFLEDDPQAHTYAQIQNTDAATKARILQMRRLKIEQIKPGNYHYYNLTLKITEKILAKQSISGYKHRVPLKLFNSEIAEKGFFTAITGMVKKLRLKKISRHYLDILGVLDGSFAYKGPFCVQIDLTNQCNNDCIGCWCNSPLLGDRKIPDQIKQQTLPFEVVKQTIDELQRMGTQEIYFAGGGEPFMHPDIMKILSHVKSKGLRCYINTNFTLVDEDMVKRLVELGVDNLVVSVWAGTARTYFDTHPNKSEEMFYQLKGMLTLLNSLKRDVPRVNIYNVVSNRNYRELPEMVDFALATNSDSLEFTVIDTIPGATDALMLTEEQRAVVTAGCEEIQKRLDNELNGKIRIQQFEQFVRRVGNRDANCAQYDKNILEEMPCYIGWLFARILADGNVNFCLKAHRIPVGNIYAHSFTHIWNSRRQQEFRKRALCPGKDDAFFSFIGNDPAAKVGCFKSCDDLARNVHMHKKIQSLTLPEIIMLKLLLVLKKIQRHVRGKTFTRAFCETVKKRDALGGKELRCRNLRVVPHSEGIRLVWNDQELTHSVGLNTSVCIFGLWYDSSKAEWEIIRQGEQEIILKNTWRNIPLSQQWHLVLDDEHTVRWRIDMLIDSKLEIEQMKTSVMLPAGYKHWSAGNQRGKFSALMAWNDMSLADATVRRIGVPGIQLKGRPVPGVCLDFSESGADTVMPQIQNSDKNINARVLSACRRVPETAAVMVPGTYPVFSGKIIISADKD